jgi:hypothetical protein
LSDSWALRQLLGPVPRALRGPAGPRRWRPAFRGGRWLSCTNVGNNVQNRSLGTAQLQALSPGANTLTYALTAADRTACFNGDKTAVRFEIRSNNPVGQARLGFEDLSVTNLIDDLPNLPDPCSPPSNPAPDPIPLSLPPSLTFEELFGQRNWRFSEGKLVSLPVIR